MITIISGTNRPGSTTRLIAGYYSELLTELGHENRLYSLEDLPREFAFTDLYGKRSAAFQEQLDTYIIPAERFVAILPEYNGTFPGIFKLMFDGIAPSILRGKKIGMVGVANGRGGNLRGLDQLTAAMHYLQLMVYPKHLPLSLIQDHLSPERVLDVVTLEALKAHASGVATF